MPKVTFLGLGVMGYPMAGYLHKAGHSVTVYNRTFAKAQKWVEEYGGQAQQTPAEAAQGADIVIACVGNDNDLRSVVLGEQGAFAGMASGSLFIDHTTASADVARELAALGKSSGIGFVDAPVSGGQAGAENGQLAIMCGKWVAVKLPKCVIRFVSPGWFRGCLRLSILPKMPVLMPNRWQHWWHKGRAVRGS